VGQRFDVQHDVGVLARAAVLLDVPVEHPDTPVTTVSRSATRGRADADLQPVVPADPFHGDLQVQLTQPGQHGLAGLRIGAHGQRRSSATSGPAPRPAVGVGAAAGASTATETSGCALAAGSSSSGASGAHSVVPVGGGLRPDDGHDVAGHRRSTSTWRSACTAGCRAIRSVRPAATSRTDIPLPQGSGVDPQVDQPPAVGRGDLEHQRRQRRVRVGRRRSAADVRRRRQVGDDRVEQRFDPALR
jgi:hypothetical protein